MGSCFSRRRVDPPPTVRRYPHPEEEEEEEEEETVKEVLSETPAIRYLDPTTPDKPEDAPGLIDERSEVSSSEICSLISENLSASSTTTTTMVTNKATEVKKKKEGDAVMRRKDAPPSPSPVKNRRKRSVSGELLQITKRDTSVGIGCRSGRTSPSLAKKMDAVVGRTYSAREVGSSKSRALQPPPPSSIVREPSGERSGRRSVSPLVKDAAKAADQKRSLSAPRMNGRASPPSRVRPPPQAEMSYENRGGRRLVMDASGEGKESLENPLVSLECFIFL